MYSDRTKKELLEILEQYQMLTFESQLSLNWELESRGLVVDKSALELAIEVKMSQINELEHLNELGFNATTDNGGITVTRTSNAIFADVIAVVFGVLVFALGVYGVGSLVSLFVNGEEINVFSLAVNLAMASLVLLGFKFLNGIQRLMDFIGFSLSNDGEGTITLKKRFDLKLEEIKDKTSELFLETDEDEITLKLGEYAILNSNADNVIQRLTIERLTGLLKKG